MKRILLIICTLLYCVLLVFSLFSIGFRFDNNMVFYTNGHFVGPGYRDWEPEWNPSSTPVIIINNMYYYQTKSRN
ncbi:MAG: hypothetical protein ACW97X_10765 [Candidatus Hodarchaeales archaeon]